MEASLHGKLSSFRLPDILTFLNVSLKTGALILTSRTRNVKIYMDNGEIVFASSNKKKFRLSKVLLNKKRIDSETSKRIESVMLDQGGKFGRVAVEQNVLTEAELQDFLKIQASEILFDCFVWDEGSFHFHDNMPLPEYAVTISVELSNLIMEGARRIDEWDRCQKLLPDPMQVFRVIATPEIQEKITLSLAEWRILFLVDGHRSLSNICEQSEDEALEVYRVMYGLLSNKLIEPLPEGDALASALLEMEVAAKDLIPAGEATTGVLRDDTGLLVSPDATLTFRDILRVSAARVTVKDTDTVYTLEEEEYLIGRTASSHICLPDPSVSSIHARIYRGPTGYVLEDLNSRNGTFVNEDRVEQRILQENDRIRMGNSELTFNVFNAVKRA